MGKMNWGQIVGSVIVGAILGTAGTLFLDAQRITRLEEQVAHLQSASVGDREEAAGRHTAAAPTVSGEEFVAIVRQQQRDNVRESYGELAGQNFTEVDLQTFIANKSTERITAKLRADKTFLAAVLSLHSLDPPSRQRILDRALSPLRPTWEELGRISRDGQTESGQRAEILIAEAIVNLAKELIALPDAELTRLYEQ